MSLTSLFQLIVCFEIDVLVCIFFPVQFSKIMCTSAVLIYITKYFLLRQMFFYFFSYFLLYTLTSLLLKENWQVPVFYSQINSSILHSKI